MLFALVIHKPILKVQAEVPSLALNDLNVAFLDDWTLTGSIETELPQNGNWKTPGSPNRQQWCVCDSQHTCRQNQQSSGCNLCFIGYSASATSSTILRSNAQIHARITRYTSLVNRRKHRPLRQVSHLVPREHYRISVNKPPASTDIATFPSRWSFNSNSR
jgi:hypothetical protein